jgi:hypothetical protein
MLEMHSWLAPRNEGKSGGIANRFNRDVNVEEWPVQMVGGVTLDNRNLLDTGISKPWKMLEREQQFFVTHQQP